MSFPDSEYRIPFFTEYGFVRKLCPVCKDYFWTQNLDQKVCGELTNEGCTPYTFINNPPTRKRYNFREMREAFISFFEKKGHEKIEPYPVVARWRDDLYFTNASIIDFQPYVTEGITLPPANPLVISQPCIRFVDVDNVGPTFGRHLTIFEMGGHHAFNSPDEEIYWKDETVRYHHEFVTKELGVKSEEVSYKEGVWSGGGNAGPCVESIIRGLEVATLVFMKFKVVGKELIELPIRTVDTGYGIERFTWLSQGSLSSFHAVYNPILNQIFKLAEINEVNWEFLERVAKLSGLMSIGKKANRGEARKKIAAHLGVSLNELCKLLFPIENVFAVVDHSKCLVLMLAEGVVPSNVREGYLARLMLRRTYKALITLGIEEKLLDIIDMQIAFWSKDFPRFREMQDVILEILSVERDKFKQALKRGKGLIKKVAQELKAKEVFQIPVKTLIDLYDSHGLPPEIVCETAMAEGIQVNIPENFYTMVAEKHVQAPPPQEVEVIEGLKEKIFDLPETKKLYYEKPYLSEFETKVLRVVNSEYVILEKTAFYPEGGGQPGDHGYLKVNKERLEVVDVQKIGNLIVHVVNGPVLKEGDEVRGFIDWERRSNLMKHHTATHLLMGAARRVLGEHVWQAGAQKGVERSRLDISHFKRLTQEEMHRIEQLANEAVMKNIPVKVSWMLREVAEKRHGFRLYQGGVVPGREIRVVKIGDWDVEACGGIQNRTTGEIGFIKIVHTERIQDGVERIVFSAGLPALKVAQQNERVLWKISEMINVPLEKVEETTERLVSELKVTRRERERLYEKIAKFEAKEYLATAKEIHGVKVIIQKLKNADVNLLIKIASELVDMEAKIVVSLYAVNETVSIVVMAGKDAIKQGINARDIAGEAASMLGGGGSGRLDFAQGGGTLIRKVPEALKKVEEIIKRQLGESVHED